MGIPRRRDLLIARRRFCEPVGEKSGTGWNPSLPRSGMHPYRVLALPRADAMCPSIVDWQVSWTQDPSPIDHGTCNLA